jgi:hypothetical protein
MHQGTQIISPPAAVAAARPSRRRDRGLASADFATTYAQDRPFPAIPAIISETYIDGL